MRLLLLLLLLAGCAAESPARDDARASPGQLGPHLYGRFSTTIGGY